MRFTFGVLALILFAMLSLPALASADVPVDDTVEASDLAPEVSTPETTQASDAISVELAGAVADAIWVPASPPCEVDGSTTAPDLGMDPRPPNHQNSVDESGQISKPTPTVFGRGHDQLPGG